MIFGRINEVEVLAGIMEKQVFTVLNQNLNKRIVQYSLIA